MGYLLLQHYEVTAATEESIVFENINQDYTDLRILISSRTDRPEFVDYIYLKVNDSASGYSNRLLYNDSGSVGETTRSSQTFGVEVGVTNGNTAIASSFNTTDLIIGKYTGSDEKRINSISTNSNYNTTAIYITHYAAASDVTDPITTLTFTALNGDFKQYSTFSLYALQAGSDGVTTVS